MLREAAHLTALQHTVENPFRGNPRNQNKCPLNKGALLLEPLTYTGPKLSLECRGPWIEVSETSSSTLWQPRSAERKRCQHSLINQAFQLKGATSRFVHLEKFSLNFSSWSFAIHVNLLHH